MKNKSKIILSKIVERYNNSELAQRMASGTFWSFSGTALAKLVVLIAGIICARILGKEAYGEFGIVRSTITVFVTLGIAGLGVTATKFISEYKKDFPERIPAIYSITTKFSLWLGILICVVIILTAQPIAVHSLNSPELVGDLRWGGILIFFTVINGVQNGVLSGFENFKSIAFNTLYGSIAESVLMCLGAWMYGVSGAIIGYGIGYIVIYVCNKVSIKRMLHAHNISISSYQFNKKDLEIIYKFSIPAALSAFLVAPIYWVIKSMLVRTEGYSQLAIFEAADQWKIMILFIPSAISNVVLPILSSVVRSSHNGFWKILKFNLLLNAGVSLILSLMVALFHDQIMGLYGKGFGGGTTLIILCASTIFISMSTVIGISISSRNKMWTGFVFNLLWGCMIIGFAYLFLSYGLGAKGLAWATLCSYVLHSIFQLAYLSRIVKIEK